MNEPETRTGIDASESRAPSLALADAVSARDAQAILDPRASPAFRAAESASDRRSFLRRTFGAGVALTCTSGGYFGWSRTLEVTYHRVDLGLGGGKGLRVTLIADLHLRGSLADHEATVRAALGTHPDLIAIAGDCVESSEDLPLLEALAPLRAPLGVWASMGNWDYRAGSAQTLGAELRKQGIELLVNEAVERGPICLIGVDDWLVGSPDLALVREIAPRGPSILLSHCPAFFGEVTRALEPDPDARMVVLAGHTHGGQIAPFGFAPITPPGSGRYVAGWYPAGSRRLYVSRGIGYSQIPIRIGARPEIAVLDLY
jgi:predicted MPP superfamily phosphohydrolase